MKLWVTCKHGEPQGHWVGKTGYGCPGGRPATRDDLIEALDELERADLPPAAELPTADDVFGILRETP